MLEGTYGRSGTKMLKFFHSEHGRTEFEKKGVPRLPRFEFDLADVVRSLGRKYTNASGTKLLRADSAVAINGALLIY